MKSRKRKLVVVVALFVATLSFTVTCGDNQSPTAPNTTTPVVTTPTSSGPVTYGPPDGVSAGVWRYGFYSDGRMHRPDAVHLVLPSDSTQEVKDTFVGVIQKINGYGLKTPYDLVSSLTGANISLMVTPNLKCGGWGETAACTTLQTDNSGRITGGKMEFAFVSFMREPTCVLYEAFRALGTWNISPVPGFFSNPRVTTEPTPEEILMLKAREDVPLLALYSDK